MLQPSKKIVSKEIKHDPLLSAYMSVTKIYDEQKKYISYGVTALVLLVIGTVVYLNNRTANDEKAATELGRVFPLYDAGASDVRQYKVAIDGQPERGMMGLKAIVENYGGTTSGEMARLYLANSYFMTAQYDEAFKHYDDFSGSTPLMKSASQAGMAKCYEVKTQYEKAASAYEKAASLAADKIETPEYLSASARCYGLAGEKEKAVGIFKRIKKEYPTSNAAREVDRFISQFSV